MLANSARQPGDRPGEYVIGAAGVSLSVSLFGQFKSSLQTIRILLQCLRMRAACTGDGSAGQQINFHIGNR
jgi:hypothetical protein